MKRILALVSMLIALTSFTGCGAVFLGSTRTIDIQGTEGAEISSTPAVGSYLVPTSLKLTRGKSYTMTFRKAGYKEQTVVIEKKFLAGTLIADILLAGIIGVVVDATSGSWYGHTPSNVMVSLERNSTGYEGPEKIDIKLSRADQDDQTFVIEGGEGVQVELTERK